MSNGKAVRNGSVDAIDVQAVRASLGTEGPEGIHLPEVQEREVAGSQDHYIAIGRFVWRYYQQRAIAAVGRAQREGRLGDLGNCVDCGAAASVWEHRDYAMPLDVVGTCQRCNLRRGPARLDVAHVKRTLNAADGMARVIDVLQDEIRNLLASAMQEAADILR